MTPLSIIKTAHSQPNSKLFFSAWPRIMVRVLFGAALGLACASSCGAFGIAPCDASVAQIRKLRAVRCVITLNTHTNSLRTLFVAFAPQSALGLRRHAGVAAHVRPRLQLGRMHAQLRPEDEGKVKSAQPKFDLGDAWQSFAKTAQEGWDSGAQDRAGGNAQKSASSYAYYVHLQLR